MIDYLKLNQEQWDQRAKAHLTSDFYDVPGWLAGAESLKAPELALLPDDLTGLKILHLQCHFGQDTLSFARRGAIATGVDLSPSAINAAEDLAQKAGLKARFINCDLYSLPEHLNEKFDIVFTSYGTITWLPDLDEWAAIVNRYLKPGGQFVFAEFHNMAYLWNDDRTAIKYPYFNPEPIVEQITKSYTDGSDEVNGTEVNWDHTISSVVTALLGAGLTLRGFQEFDYSPYNCFDDMVPAGKPGHWHLRQMPGLIPLVYTLDLVK
ncbi:MAG: class I SAM-dependent methyltransferase [Lewinella sp.]|jgi:SAM-dependent methyltransferase|nr:class I SAM-dependent methyltransferase [Lewinella sp.]